jgi:glycosyltransferase involved in cell wall biosynthesis
MAGPAIRAVEIGKELAKSMNVTVFSPKPSEFKESSELYASNNFHLVTNKSKKDLQNIANLSDVIFIQANVLKAYPFLADLGKFLVVDLYDPYLFSLLAQYANEKTSQQASYNLMHQILQKHLTRADFSICASEQQRDYWLGRYCAIGKLNTKLYDFDPSFRKLIDVVPFGLSENEPVKTGQGLRQITPGINQDDFVLLWGGGIWEWFDPITIISAVGKLCTQYPKIKLYFMGMKSPNPQVPLMNMALKAKAHAEKLGLLNRHVFFNETWIPYHDRANYLLDADVGVLAHFDLIETRFSFRTRVLDYLWSKLPIITTVGDELASKINNQAGLAVNYQDIDSWVTAVETLYKNKDLLQKYKEGASQLAKEFHWKNVVKPLQSYCDKPYRLPDFKKIRMPSPITRMKAVYDRGGTELLINRSKELAKDFLK